MYRPTEPHLTALRAAAPACELAIATDEPSARALIADADGVLGNRYFLQSLPAARRLRWMQSNSVGVDLIVRGGGAALDAITLCSARGCYDDEIAEHALALVLALYRGLPDARDAQRDRRWQQVPLRTVRDRRALLLGWGGIGRASAQRLRALGVSVSAVRQSHLGSPTVDSDGYRIYGPDTWRDALPTTDIVVLALPLTAETRHLVGAAELDRLPTDAVVVNVGRGGTLDERALCERLANGRLSGAALDVLESEPPATANPVWTTPGLLLTPHVARSREAPPYAWEPLFVENLRRFAAGEPLLNVVDKTKGY